MSRIWKKNNGAVPVPVPAMASAPAAARMATKKATTGRLFRAAAASSAAAATTSRIVLAAAVLLVIISMPQLLPAAAAAAVAADDGAFAAGSSPPPRPPAAAASSEASPGGGGGGGPVQNDDGEVEKRAAIAFSSPTPSIPSSCPTTSESLRASYGRYHSDATCDRGRYDAYKRSLGKNRIRERLRLTGQHAAVPNSRTVICPAVVRDLRQLPVRMDGRSGSSPSLGSPPTTGFDTSWIVENTASKPVVLAFVASADADAAPASAGQGSPSSPSSSSSSFREVSAMDATIYPPEKDPNAILMPGQWKHVHVYEGHVFHVREIDEDGRAGRVLLQHRVGLIPVGAKAGHLLECSNATAASKQSEPPRKLAKKLDPEPVVVVRKRGGGDANVKVRDPNFRRTLVPVVDKATRQEPVKECHLLDVGFRNVAGCPLHGYWVHPDSCDETFKLHLGTSTDPRDFMWDWQSPTKFEQTFVGHTFVFRSASQPELGIVDRVTLQPTQVVDCPDGMKQREAAAAAAAAPSVGIGRATTAKFVVGDNATAIDLLNFLLGGVGRGNQSSSQVPSSHHTG